MVAGVLPFCLVTISNHHHSHTEVMNCQPRLLPGVWVIVLPDSIWRHLHYRSAQGYCSSHWNRFGVHRIQALGDMQLCFVTKRFTSILDYFSEALSKSDFLTWNLKPLYSFNIPNFHFENALTSTYQIQSCIWELQTSPWPYTYGFIPFIIV